MNVASGLILAAAVYVGLGVLFALPFVMRGAGRIDPAAHGAPWGFRIMIFPGCVAFWPILLRKWVAASPAREHP